MSRSETEARQAAAVSQFHLAFPVTDLARARAFYGGILGCPEGRCSDQYVDFDFYGHQIVAHLVTARADDGRSAFDGHEVPVPHFGLNMDRSAWWALRERIEQAQLKFVEEPHQRLVGKPGQHLTMFLFDPFGNALEFKSFDDQSDAFATEQRRAATA
jgi:extradiol dioxygenase family protein